MRVLGLMSGTSADGVDAALASFRGRPDSPDWTLLNTASVPYPEDLRVRLIQVARVSPPASATFLSCLKP